ncbi:hypothetical protein WGT02_20400 [Rhizobium sp. T1470]|uniref:Uncharacterized protein n=1 Tax=Rhizobium favelukesii TaxID=348824 RepID=W6RZ15_9HYPH|nr:hypothetical protein [Rhizobium sp. T1473]MCA0803513.1 hypothetical protein [Rhizobium sp. T1473]CDM59501.1 putative predicted protein [Rhizobium favelukesii]
MTASYIYVQKMPVGYPPNLVVSRWLGYAEPPHDQEYLSAPKLCHAA